MHVSTPSLHDMLLPDAGRRAAVRELMGRLLARRRPPSGRAAGAAEVVTLPLTTVSESGNFDAWVHVQFPSAGGAIEVDLLVDSGNSTLVVPNGEDLLSLPAYRTLGQGQEPWGCPAAVLQGPVQILAVDGTAYEIADCVFYACTGENASGQRTANFGVGCLAPWTASRWNTPAGVPETLRSPLAYDAAHPYAELVYAPAGALHAPAGDLHLDDSSSLVLHPGLPPGFTLLGLVPGVPWMCVVPGALAVDGRPTAWPGTTATPPLAMVDTGGGPLFLSDPRRAVCGQPWSSPVACPSWTASSVDCCCIGDRLTVELLAADRSTSYSYTIDTAGLPAPAQGLTAVFCEQNAYMQGRDGMNLGGISALFNRILICYGEACVGFAAR